MMRLRYHCVAAAASVVSVGLSGADRCAAIAAEVSHVDVTKNPGCGVRLIKKADKIARNERLAEYYFTGYLGAEQKAHNKQYHWTDYDCMADGATVRMGYGLKPEPPEFVDMPAPHRQAGVQPAAQSEQDLVHDVFPDWGTIPGTLRAYPSENAVFFIMRFGGHSVTGDYIEYWETDFIAVNDDGKITHWEGYNDTMGVDKLFRRVLGKGVEEIGTRKNYHRILAERGEKALEKEKQ